MNTQEVVPAFGWPGFDENLARYSFARQYVRQKNVLVVGCKKGFGSFAVSTVASKITAIDSDPEALEFAQKNYPHVRISYSSKSLEEVSEKFDAVIAFDLVENLDQPEFQKFLKGVENKIHKGGVLIFNFSDINKLTVVSARGFSKAEFFAQSVRPPNLKERIVGLFHKKKSTSFDTPLDQPSFFWRPEQGWDGSTQYVFVPSKTTSALSIVAVAHV